MTGANQGPRHGRGWSPRSVRSRGCVSPRQHRCPLCLWRAPGHLVCRSTPARSRPSATTCWCSVSTLSTSARRKLAPSRIRALLGKSPYGARSHGSYRGRGPENTIHRNASTPRAPPPAASAPFTQPFTVFSPESVGSIFVHSLPRCHTSTSAFQPRNTRHAEVVSADSAVRRKGAPFCGPLCNGQRTVPRC